MVAIEPICHPERPKPTPVVTQSEGLKFIRLPIVVPPTVAKVLNRAPFLAPSSSSPCERLLNPYPKNSQQLPHKLKRYSAHRKLDFDDHSTELPPSLYVKRVEPNLVENLTL